MRERVKRLGGTFEIEGEPNQGTTIRVSIPLISGKKAGGMEK
jgi:signal transduction histidine kinase